MNNLQITIQNLGGFDNWGNILDIDETTINNYRVLTIYNSFEIKEELKANGFQYNENQKAWFKGFEVSEIEKFLVVLAENNEISFKYVGVQPSASVGLENILTTTTNKAKTRYTSVLHLKK